MPVFTAPFAAVLERHMTYFTPDQPMPFAVLDHPMQNISDAEIEQRAEMLATAIERHLPPP